MSEIGMQIPFPLDDDGFFRRECPLCNRQFKALVPEDERQALAQRCLENHLLEEGLLESESEEDEPVGIMICPYCGQESALDSWWTQEQLNYLGMYLKNIVADAFNEHFVKPLKREARRNSGGLFSISFKADKMEHVEPWIPPEENDMTVLNLPCCDDQIKVADGWKDVVHCPFCSFPYQQTQP